MPMATAAAVSANPGHHGRKLFVNADLIDQESDAIVCL
jgi:hypothetical protein